MQIYERVFGGPSSPEVNEWKERVAKSWDIQGEREYAIALCPALTLTEFVDGKADVSSQTHRLRGNILFRIGTFILAKSAYERAEKTCDSADTTNVVDVWNNLCLCCMRTGDLDEADTYVTRVLEVDPQNEKALYRKAALTQFFDCVFNIVRLLTLCFSIFRLKQQSQSCSGD